VPTQTPAIVIITVLPPTPAIAPTEPAKPTPMPTPTPQPAPTAVAVAKPTTAPVQPAVSKSAATTPGVLLDFENSGSWRIGDEPYGSFVASTEQKHSGQTSGKLAYQLPAVAKNYVVFRRIPAAPIPGQPAALKLWVYGDGSGHFLNVWVRDSQDEVRQFTFGQITHTGWQELEAPLDAAAAWPQAHISGADNGRLDFPISLDSLVLDGVPDGGGPFTGTIYLDDLSAGDATAPKVPAAASAVPVASPAASGPPTGLTGHIVYTSGAGNATAVSVLDVAKRNTWELRGNARQPDIRGDGRVVFNGIGGGKNNIFSVNLDGSGEVMNGMHPEDSYPSWSPTGVSAVFHSSLQGDGKDRIYIQKDMSHTEEPKWLKINNTVVFGKYPTWLETWRVAFTGCNYWASGSNCGIWTANSDDSGSPTQLTTDTSDISTDSAGGSLLFASPRTGNWDVYAVPQGGGTPQNLTNRPSQDVGGTFSPDRRYVAFMSDRDGGWGIWVMNADGSNPQKLVDVPGFGAGWVEEHLAWGP
jgi:Tol biopolymer transport system component